jgi:hypothetical protein
MYKKYTSKTRYWQMTKLLVALAGGVTTFRHVLFTVITTTPSNRILLE